MSENRSQPAPFRPLSRRVIASLAAVMVAMGVIGSLSIVLFAQREARRTLEIEAQILARSISYAAETLVSESDLRRLVNSLGAEPDVELITIVGIEPDGTRRVYASTRNSWVLNELAEVQDADRPVEIEGVLRSGLWVSRELDGASLYDYMVPVTLSPTVGAQMNGVVVVRLDTSGARSHALAWSWVMGSGLVLVLGFLSWFAMRLLRHLVLGPIEQISVALREGGEFAHVPVSRNDEIGRLAETLNEAHREAAMSAGELEESRQESERAVREIAALRRALDEHTILSITDQSGKILDANKGFCDISGYTRDELLGQDHRIVNSGTHGKAFWVDVWRTIARGTAWRGEVCNKRKDGSIYWVDTTIVPYLNARGEVEKYVSIRFDVTAQKAAEDALKVTREQARAESKSKSEFLANMSHEIRTPMTAILGFTDLLYGIKGAPPSASQQLDFVETIRRNGEHLLSVINDVLDMSKIEAGRLSIESQPVAPDELLRDVKGLMLVKSDAKGLDLRAEFVTGMPSQVRTDPLRARQVLVNLVGNAIKFTETGGVTVRCGYEGDELWFEVSDTGIGIAEEDQARLFNPFEQADNSTSRKFGGTGLGLNISQRLAGMLGGEISVESTAGQGSTFRFTVRAEALQDVNWFPAGVLREDGRIARNGEPDEPVDLPLDGLRILLAEDGPDNIVLLNHYLKRAGALVTTVQNGRRAVEELTADGTVDGDLRDGFEYDMMLTDVQMPEMDGYEATRRLRDKGCELPIIALTAHAMAGDMDKCLSAGCDGYASKPIDRALLIALCQRAADGRLRGGRGQRAA